MFFTVFAASWMTLARVSALSAFALVALVHLISPGFNPITRPMSDYATGRFGFLMASAIGAFGVSGLGLARGLAQSTPRAGVALLNVAGIAYLGASIFPTDARLDNTVTTLAGAIHFIAGYLSSPALVSAAILLSREPRAFALAVALWTSLVILVIVNILEWQIGGFGQRVFFALALAWVTTMAARKK